MKFTTILKVKENILRKLSYQEVCVQQRNVYAGMMMMIKISNMVHSPSIDKEATSKFSTFQLTILHGKKRMVHGKMLGQTRGQRSRVRKSTHYKD